MSKKVNKKKNNKGQIEESELIDINKFEPTEDQVISNTNNNIQVSKFTKIKHKRDPENEEVEIIKSNRKKYKKGMTNLEEEIVNLDDKNTLDMNQDLEDDHNFFINLPKNFTKASQNKNLENQYKNFLPFSSTSRTGLSLGKTSNDLFNRHFPPIFNGKLIKKIILKFFISIL